jgi:hypothetical protein
MSAVKKERTPEKIESDRARMAAVRAKKGTKPQVSEISPQIEPKKLTRVEHKRSASIPDELEGLTANDCCAACRPDRCVISGAAICIHPFKSGIQSAFQTRPDVVERYNRAKKMLAHAKIDLT